MASNQQDRVLITGGTGFAGSHLIEYLIETGVPAELIFTTHLTPVPAFLRQLLPDSHFLKADLTNADDTKAVFEEVRPAKIYHLASFAAVGESYEKREFVMMNNIKLQLTVLDQFQAVVPKARLLSIGSADAYGLSLDDAELPITENHPFRPTNPYAVSKISQEMLSFSYYLSHQLDVVRIRPFNHIGERQEPAFAVPAFAKQIVAIERGQQAQLAVGDLTATRDFTDVKDMVRAYLTVMENGVSGDVYNIGSGKGVVMSDLLEELIELAQAKIEVVEDPDKIRPLDIPVIIANNTKIKHLGWKSQIPLSQTLERVLTYWRAQ
ncbi:MAG: GDP-mannose 4,6-dehydratase [Patescibacteria group bacterium]